MNKKEKLVKEALTLSATERAEVIERLIKSLDKPDESIDKLWKKEVENRIDAYGKGNMPVLTVDEVISKYKKDS